MLTSRNSHIVDSLRTAIHASCDREMGNWLMYDEQTSRAIVDVLSYLQGIYHLQQVFKVNFLDAR